MFKHLLVPLDGSQLAEVVLPAAAYLAEQMGAWVTLVHVIERNAPQEVHGERHLTQTEEAYAYLQKVATRFFPANIRVEQHVHTAKTGDVARTITEHVEELGSDLIIMCTHGRSGWRDWLFGSIAQQVIALGMTPVLLIQPAGAAASSFACRRLLVPLDGQPDHEQGLVVAVGLAKVCQASLHLVLAVPTLHTLSGQEAATAKLLPAATSALLDLTQQDAETYLDQRLAEVRAAGLVATAQVERGGPARVIVRTARRMKADLIVLGTHRKKGMEAFWEGSVTPKVSGRSRIPLLLVPVQGEA